MGVNVNAADQVSAAPPAAATPLRPSPSTLAARHPAAPPSPPPLTACGAAAAPPQNSYGYTALMYAAREGKLDCLEHLTAKSVNVNVRDNVRRPHT